jgi:hypothetical protein
LHDVTEQRIQQEIRIACSNGDTRLFRNNTGTLRTSTADRFPSGSARAALT